MPDRTATLDSNQVTTRSVEGGTARALVATLANNPAGAGGATTPLVVTIAPTSPLYARVQVTPTISTLIYAAGDVVGGLLNFDFTHPYGGGLIHSFGIVDDDNENAPFSVYLFDSAPTVVADQAVWATAMLIADLKKMIYPNLDPIRFVAGDYQTINGNSVAVKVGLNRPFAGNNIYAYVVPTGTPTYTAATDLTFSITVMR